MILFGFWLIPNRSLNQNGRKSSQNDRKGLVYDQHQLIVIIVLSYARASRKYRKNHVTQRDEF